MKRKFLALLGGLSLFFLFSPLLVQADCVSPEAYTSWVPQGDQQIAFYRGSTPLGVLTLQDCRVNSNSTIVLVKNYVCDSDTIIIDGTECALMSVASSSF
jgi:hypothetical protein